MYSYAAAVHVQNYYFASQSLEEQFPPDEGYKISRYNEFKFKSDAAQPSIKLSIPTKYDQCVIALEPANARVCIVADNITR